MSIADIGNYDYLRPDPVPGRTPSAGKPTVFAPRRGKFIPPSRVSEQRRQAVGIGRRDCFYHGAPPILAKGQYSKKDDGASATKDKVVVPNTADNCFKTVYQEDFEGSLGSKMNMERFDKVNSADAAYGRVPVGGFVKYHDVENSKNFGSIPDEKYDMVYSQGHVMGQVPDMTNLGAVPVPEKPKRAAVDYASLKHLSKARERMNMRTLNFSELPGQDLNPKPMRKGHEEYGDRHKASQITWAYHG
jgi:hypothetical protein